MKTQILLLILISFNISVRAGIAKWPNTTYSKYEKLPMVTKESTKLPLPVDEDGYVSCGLPDEPDSLEQNSFENIWSKTEPKRREPKVHVKYIKKEQEKRDPGGLGLAQGQKDTKSDGQNQEEHENQKKAGSNNLKDNMKLLLSLADA